MISNLKNIIMLIKTPEQVKMELAKRVSERRLELNLSRQGLADRSGVPFSTLRAFEREGKISLESLLKLAVVLGELKSFENLFAYKVNEFSSLDEILIEDSKRQRGRLK